MEHVLYVINNNQVISIFSDVILFYIDLFQSIGHQQSDEMLHDTQCVNKLKSMPLDQNLKDMIDTYIS